jgi:prepilin-type N-terminal cleavage/methylation domain-containing protein
MARREPHPARRRARIRGFTLLELVAVLLVVAILAVVAVPLLTGTQSITLPAVKAQVVSAIRYTQSLAMTRGQRYRINFTASTYQITDMGGAPIVQPSTASTAPVSVSPAALGGYDPPLTGAYVAFDSKGVPYVGAAAALGATATIVITSGGDSATITISPETGSVR